MINKKTINLVCFSDSECPYAFIPIFKNAHNWGISFFKKYCYFKKNKVCKSNKKFIIFLRDPYERWISAVTQWIVFRIEIKHDTNYVVDNLLIELMSMTVNFDGHTTPQSVHTKPLLEQNCDIIYFDLDDKKFEENIKHFAQVKLGITVPKKHIPKLNTTLDNPIKVQITEQIKKYLATRPILVQNIKEYYKEDYKLIETCKFYRYNDYI